MTKNVILMLLILIFFSYNCKDTYSKKKIFDNCKKYQDINLFSLIGINPDSSLKYPFLCIDSINKNQKVLMLFYSDNLLDTTNYTCKGSYWSANY